jgi:hypothetical protein
MELWLPIARMRDAPPRSHAAIGRQRSDATILVKKWRCEDVGKRMTEK